MILFHMFIVFTAFYNMKPKTFGSFINSTVIRCCTNIACHDFPYYGGDTLASTD